MSDQRVVDKIKQKFLITYDMEDYYVDKMVKNLLRPKKMETI